MQNPRHEYILLLLHLSRAGVGCNDHRLLALRWRHAEGTPVTFIKQIGEFAGIRLIHSVYRATFDKNMFFAKR